MSVEDKHFPVFQHHTITSKDIADLRQELYDAKLAISQGDYDEATKKIISALDRTTEWTP